MYTSFDVPFFFFFLFHRNTQQKQFFACNFFLFIQLCRKKSGALSLSLSVPPSAVVVVRLSVLFFATTLALGIELWIFFKEISSINQLFRLFTVFFINKYTHTYNHRPYYYWIVAHARARANSSKYSTIWA